VALTAFYVISSELVLLDPRLSSIDTGLPNGNYHVPIIFYLDVVYSNKQNLTWYQLDTSNNHTDNKTMLDLNYNTIFN